MAKVYDNIDLVWTDRGDIVVSHNGDLMDTEYDPLRSIVQEIRTRLEADLGDWSLYEEVGAQLSDYVGEPNIKVTAEAIKTRIISALTRNGLIDRRDLKVSYAPTDIDKIMFRLKLSVAPTSQNRGSADLLIIALYSYSENNVYVRTNF